jgi:hypothetical protein
MAKLRQVFYPAKFSPFFQLYNFEPLFPTLKSWITHHQEWMPMVVGSRFFTTASAAAEVAADGVENRIPCHITEETVTSRGRSTENPPQALASTRGSST